MTKNWSSDFKFGFNLTDFKISNSKATNEVYETDLVFGTQLGIGIDRYFKLKRFNYIVIGLGMDYYSTDYSKLCSYLKPGSINYTLTIAYKGFFKKMID